MLFVQDLMEKNILL